MPCRMLQNGRRWEPPPVAALATRCALTGERHACYRVPSPLADASTDLKIIRSLIHELLQGEQPAAIGSALVVP